MALTLRYEQGDISEIMLRPGMRKCSPRPKNPADRNQALRDLAKGEECQVRLPLCRRHPDYTVWAHTNTQADQKGMGYKGHDSAGMFACDRCHEVIDRRLLPPLMLENVVREAQERTAARLRAIAASPTIRPRRIAAAKWALRQREERERDMP